MTERGSVHVERATTCPFVAFDDDRDERSDLPDHRHRCYAETPPAPRALAHQEAYCLSSGFPACPVFQDWARREAARSRQESSGAGGATRAGASRSSAVSSDGSGDDGVDDDADRFDGAGAAAPMGSSAALPGHGPDDEAAHDPPTRDPRVREVQSWDDDPLSRPRQVRREWAEPPPWAAGAPTASRSRSDDDDDDSDFADRPRPADGAGLASSRWLVDGPTRRPSGERETSSPDDDEPQSPSRRDDAARTPSFLSTRGGRGGDGRDDGRPDRGAEEREAAPARPELAGLAGRPRSGAAGRLDAARRPQAGGRPSGADRGRVLGQARPARAVDHDDGTPAWERPRRFEAYPTLKTRVGMPSLSPLVVGIAALIVAALLLFFVVPGLFVGGGPVAQTTPSPSVSASASTAPVTPAAPTPQTYTVKAGDTLTSIARRFGVTQNQILKANPDIKDPNKIAVGDVLTIPTKGSGGVITSEPSTSPSDSTAP